MKLSYMIILIKFSETIFIFWCTTIFFTNKIFLKNFIASLWKYVFVTQMRSSHQRCSVNKGALRNFTKLTRKHLCQSLFFNLLKNKLWHRCFPENFAIFLRIPFLQNTSGRLLPTNSCFCKWISANKITEQL